MQDATPIFQSIKQPDVFAYTAMSNCLFLLQLHVGVLIMLTFFSVNAYGRNGMGEEAIDLYRQMPEQIRNPVTHMCVLNACSHAGLVDQARLIFDRIHTKTDKIIVTMVRSF